MMKFSSVAVLLILSPLIAGSARPVPSAAPQRHPAPTQLLDAKAAAAGDEWLTLILGGVLVALQLRRTHKSSRLSRLSF